VAHLVCELKRKLVGPFLGDGMLAAAGEGAILAVQRGPRR
jgi:hypothetical protein